MEPGGAPQLPKEILAKEWGGREGLTVEQKNQVLKATLTSLALRTLLGLPMSCLASWIQEQNFLGGGDDDPPFVPLLLSCMDRTHPGKPWPATWRKRFFCGASLSGWL